MSARMRTPGPRDRAREEREPRPAKSDDIRHAAVWLCVLSCSSGFRPLSWYGLEAMAPRGERRGILAFSVRDVVLGWA